jgi:hypothetical protein
MSAAISMAGMYGGRGVPRRNSKPEDAARGFWRPIEPEEAARIMKVARHYAEANRKKGVQPLTPATLRVLETFLFKAMDWSTGKLDWSYQQIADKAGRCVDSVWRAILQLEAGGWLERMRRCAPNPNAGPGEAPFIQITNAYRIQLPKDVRLWWQSIGIARRCQAPVSADIEHERAVRAGEASLMEPQNHQLVGEREMERRRAQRAAAKVVRAVSPREAQSTPGPANTEASQGRPGQGRRSQAEMAAYYREVHDRRRLGGSADSGNP